MWLSLLKGCRASYSAPLERDCTSAAGVGQLQDKASPAIRCQSTPLHTGAGWHRQAVSTGAHAMLDFYHRPVLPPAAHERTCLSVPGCLPQCLAIWSQRAYLSALLTISAAESTISRAPKVLGSKAPRQLWSAARWRSAA